MVVFIRIGYNAKLRQIEDTKKLWLCIGSSGAMYVADLIQSTSCRDKMSERIRGMQGEALSQKRSG